MIIFSLHIWAPKHSDRLLTGHNHITAFLAACKISDKRLQCTDYITSINYGDDDVHICGSHKLYHLPMALVTQSTSMAYCDFVDYVLARWKKGEMIRRLADELKISRYFA
jgi:hypothetical protein